MSSTPAGVHRGARSCGGRPMGLSPTRATSPPQRQSDELQRLLASRPREPTDPRHKRDQDRTFGEACDRGLTTSSTRRHCRPSTVRDYRNAVVCYLLPEFGASTLPRTIDTRPHRRLPRAAAHRGRALSPHDPEDPRPALRILKRAKRKGWLDANPAEDAERVTVRRTGDFSVLSPDEVQAIARADGSTSSTAPIFRHRRLHGPAHGRAACPSLGRRRLHDRIVHVGATTSAPPTAPPSPQRVRSVPMTDQVAVASRASAVATSCTGPEDLVFCTLGFNEPFINDTVRTRFYVALTACRPRCPPRKGRRHGLTTASSSMTCATPSAPWPSKPFHSQT